MCCFFNYCSWYKARKAHLRGDQYRRGDWEMEEQYIRRLDVKIIGPALRQLEVISLVSLQLLPGQANGWTLPEPAFPAASFPERSFCPQYTSYLSIRNRTRSGGGKERRRKKKTFSNPSSTVSSSIICAPYFSFFFHPPPTHTHTRTPPTPALRPLHPRVDEYLGRLQTFLLSALSLDRCGHRGVRLDTHAAIWLHLVLKG